MIVKYYRSRMRKVLPVVLFVVVSVVAYYLLSNVVKAEVGATEISWTNVPPTTFSSDVVPNIDPGLCPDFHQVKEIYGYSDLKKVCLTSGDNFKVGIYQNGSLYQLAVGFRFDTKMYKVNGICWYINECRYLPGSDALVVTQKVSGNATSLVIYKNFTHRLILNIKEGIISKLEYDFDTSNPDYTFQRASGTLWLTGSIGVSDNGDWLAVELRQSGVGLLNIKTLEMKRISAAPFYYGYGMDPTAEFAVSNDGKHVAVMGANAGIAVYDVNSDCGEPATDDSVWTVGYMTQSCKQASIDVTGFIRNFKNGIQPKFDDNGGELSFFAFSYVDPSHNVTLRANGYVRPRLDYLALGDSFTSGEGETDDNYYLNGTNDEFEKCHVSTRSYPYLIANLSDIDPTYMRSVACSGARTEDVIGNDSGYLGQGKRLGIGGINLSPPDIILSKDQSKNSFIPGHIRQNTFVEKYRPSVVTIGIGGNDAGFMETLKTCIGPNTCDAAGTSEDREQTAIEIKNLFNTLVETYKNIYMASPNSKIYAIGYPKIINQDGDCGLSLGYLLDDTEKQFVNEGIVYLNEVIEAAAKSVGIKYINTQDAFGDHVLCGEIEPGAMNSIVLGDDTNLVNDSRWFRFIGNEGFHPNSFGHALTANSIIDSVGNIMDYDFCGNGTVICPDKTITAPEPSTYWMPDGYHGYPTQKVADFVFDRDGATDNRQKQLITDSNSLTPNSYVDIDITSTPMSLGRFEVSSDGSLDINVDLPIELEEGYHTVHLYGTSYSGESIELYQVIEYRKPFVEPDIQPQQPIIDIVDDTNNTDIVNIADNTGDTNSNNVGDNMNDQPDTTVESAQNKPDTTVANVSGGNVSEIIIAINDEVVDSRDNNVPRQDPVILIANPMNRDDATQQTENLAISVDEEMVKGASTVTQPKMLAFINKSDTKSVSGSSSYSIIGSICIVVILMIFFAWITNRAKG